MSLYKTDRELYAEEVVKNANNPEYLRFLDYHYSSRHALLHVMMTCDSPVDAVRLVLDAGANPDVVERASMSPAIAYCFKVINNGYQVTKVAQLLLEYGAELNFNSPITREYMFSDLIAANNCWKLSGLEVDMSLILRMFIAHGMQITNSHLIGYIYSYNMTCLKTAFEAEKDLVVVSRHFRMINLGFRAKLEDTFCIDFLITQI